MNHTGVELSDKLPKIRLINSKNDTMDRFLEMQTFNAVVDAGSFVKAAEALNLPKAAMSRYVADLEARLGVRLLHRTTRRLSLTEEGEIFYMRCKEVLAGLDEAESEITSRNTAASGLLSINAPVTFGVLHLAPLWGEFLDLHPKVTLEVALIDRVVDLVEEGYDLAIRIASLPSSSLISRRLTSTRLILCASPEYLKKKGVPMHPADLAGHSVISYSYLATRDEWFFEGSQGALSVKTHPSMRTNSGETCRAAALAHQGIVLQPDFLIGDDLATGRLVELMPEYRSIELGIYAVYPTRKHVPPKVRAVIDFLTTFFAHKKW